MELLVVNMRILRNNVTVCRIDMTSLNRVIRGDWLRKPTNIKYKNNGDAVYNNLLGNCRPTPPLLKLTLLYINDHAQSFVFCWQINCDGIN